MFHAITYVLALAIALALPHAGVAPLISIAVPVVAVAITVLVTLAPWGAAGRVGGRRVRAAVLAGAARRGGRAFAVAVGVVRFAGPDGSVGSQVFNLAVTALVFGVVFLGEEIGWRGILLFRLGTVMSGRRAVLVTGACHAVFRLPLLTVTTTYQSAGNRWIVCSDGDGDPDAGRGLVWLAAAVVGDHLAGEPVAQRLQQPHGGRGGSRDHHLAGRDGLHDHGDRVVTMLIVLVTAVYLLTRRAADFRMARSTPDAAPDGDPNA